MTARVTAAELDETIILQRRVGTRDAYGEVVEAWVTAATIYARHRTFQAREGELGPTTVSRVVEMFTIRRRSGVDAAMRISWRGRTFDVNSVTEIGRRWLELRATEAA